MKSRAAWRCRSLAKHRMLVDWLFARCIAILNLGTRTIKYRDFSRAKTAAERERTGLVSPDTMIIWIGRKGDPATKILLHELIHILCTYSSIYDGDDEETVVPEKSVVALEGMLWQLFTPQQKRILQAFLPPNRRGNRKPKTR